MTSLESENPSILKTMTGDFRKMEFIGMSSTTEIEYFQKGEEDRYYDNIYGDTGNFSVVFAKHILR